VPSNSRSWQLSFPAAVAVWAVIVGIAAFAGNRMGLRGRQFFLALAIAAVLFGFEFLLSAPPVMNRARNLLRGRGAIFAPLVPLFAVLIYTLSVTGNWKMMLLGAAYAVLPALLLASSAGKAPGTWEDHLGAVLIWIPVWLPVPFRLLYLVFSYPPPLTHTMAILMALSTGVAAFVLVRRLDGVGYTVEWARGFFAVFGTHFALLAAIAVPVGIKIGFLSWEPSIRRLKFPLWALGILFFTAWPEEFLFRGVLQNLLSRTFKNQWAGLVVASVIFGFAHIFHAPAPNWKYVLLATIAGLFYGHVWMKTRSLLPGTLLHALIDIFWHILFR
jgi:membrane protease YdiL (CAAX protease family)